VDYASQQRNPGKHAVGIGIVIAMHVLLAWALVSGLARKVVDVIKAPIETKIIEEVQPPPPPPLFAARVLHMRSWFSGAYEMCPVSKSFSSPPMRCMSSGVPGMAQGRPSVFGSRKNG
jgi:hypothetical protein